MKQKVQAGFVHIGIVLLAVIVLGAIGGSGYYVWHKNHDKKKTDTNTSQTQPSTKTASTTTYDECTKAIGSKIQTTYPQVCVTKDGQRFTQPINKLTNMMLTNSKLLLSFDKTVWKIENKKSDVDANCGPQDFATLTDAKSTTVTFALGACGKGGGVCFDEPNSGCIAQSKKLAQVKLSGRESAYVLVQRTSTDSGKTWEYNVWLSDKSTCTDSICVFTAKNLTSNPSTIHAQLSFALLPTSLDNFANLPEVKAVTAVFKSVHY